MCAVILAFALGFISFMPTFWAVTSIYHASLEWLWRREDERKRAVDDAVRGSRCYDSRDHYREIYRG